MKDDAKPRPLIVNYRKPGPIRDFDPELSKLARELIPDVDSAVDAVAFRLHIPDINMQIPEINPQPKKWWQKWPKR